MKTMLIPTDFSETSKNAALYGIRLGKQLKMNKIILYNAYEILPVLEPSLNIPVMQIETFNLPDLKKSSEENLENFRVELMQYCEDCMELDTLSEYGMVARDINEVSKKNGVDIIVMGVTGAGKLAESLMGSTAVDVARDSELPVVIVPPLAEVSDVKEVMFACDFSKVKNTLPVTEIRNLLADTGANLLVVNIDHNNKHFTVDTPLETSLLDDLLAGCNPEYQFIDDADFVEGINRVALEKKVDLIITIPKKTGWFDGLFKKNHTKALAFHSHVPLMIIHE
ncbi:MAG: universal stress protein [Ferruginibacter sp.]